MSIQFSYQLTNTNIYAHLLYRIHPADAKKIDQSGLLEVIQDSVKQQNNHLNHQECNILIFADTFGVIPEQGVGGRCGDADLINIFIDPQHKTGVQHNVKKWLPSALAHELYHARRYVTHPFGKTLGEALIEEGLPSLFEEFMQSDLAVPYAHHLENDELAKAWKHAQSLLYSENYNRDEWFYGSDSIKRWTGYSLGYAIVRQYMKKRGEQNPARLVDVAAREFLSEYVL